MRAWLLAPKTLFLFWNYFRLAGDPRPLRHAWHYTRRTL
jgi:hypothetical protein